MPIEPHNALSMPRPARAIYTREPAPFVAPVLTMAQLAAQENRAMHKHNGSGTYRPTSGTTPAQRKAQIEQRLEWFNSIRDQLAQSPMTYRELREFWGIGKSVEVKRMASLEYEGYVRRVNSVPVRWRLA